MKLTGLDLGFSVTDKNNKRTTIMKMPTTATTVVNNNMAITTAITIMDY